MTLDEMIAGLEEIERSVEDDLVKIIKAQEIGLFLFTPERQLAKTIENRRKSDLQKIKRNLGWFRELKRFRERENSMTIKAFASKLCEDAISREQVLDEIHNCLETRDYTLGHLYDVICELPSVQPEQRVGRWIKDELGSVVCSECAGYRRDNRVNHIAYCNKCGVKMVDEEIEE